MIQITYTVPNASEIIQKASVKYDKNILIGAGTVLDSTTARIAIESGAKFIVSPHLQPGK